MEGRNIRNPIRFSIVLICLLTFTLYEAVDAANPLDVIINEVAWMGAQASTSDEWLELYNTTDQDIDLTGWTLEAADGTPSITLSGTIPAHGYFLLERTDDSTVSDITADQIYTGALENGGEVLALKDPSDNVIDTANGDGGGWPAGDNSTKSSMERIDPLAPDSDTNWATNNGVDRNGLDADGNPINGTPKALNSASDVNQAPACNDISVGTDEDMPIDIDLGSYCTDPDGDPLTGSFVSDPPNGTAEFLSPTIRYTPDENFHGSDSFTFRVGDGELESNTATVNVTVNPVNDPPVAVAGCSPLTLNEGETVNCDGSDSDDIDGDPLAFSWDFGDGGTGSGSTVAHTYADNGPPPDLSHTITLTVQDGRGGTDTAGVTVTVHNVSPTVEAGPDQTADVGQAVSFAGSFTDPGTADTHTIEWDFGDGATTSGTLTPTHTYSAAGVYTVVLTVTDDDGGVGQDTLAVTVNAPTLTATKRITEPTGPFVFVGEEIAYEVVITNAGNASQPDNPEPEFQDPIPADTGFVEGSLTASSGAASFDEANERVMWNGALAPGESVTLTFRVHVGTVPTGTSIANQGQTLFDADGDGSNESARPSDDPGTPESNDPTLSPPAVLRGDSNGDGRIDIRDAITCAEGALALRSLTELQQAACDVAPPSGIVDGRDVVTIAELALGGASARGRPDPQVGPAVPLRVERVSVRPWGSDLAGYRFVVQGRGIRSIAVEVFDLRGRRVFHSGEVHNGVAWHGQSSYGGRLSNGIYLYIVTVYGANGEVLRSEVRRLVLLR